MTHQILKQIRCHIYIPHEENKGVIPRHSNARIIVSLFECMIWLQYTRICIVYIEIGILKYIEITNLHIEITNLQMCLSSIPRAL